MCKNFFKLSLPIVNGLLAIMLVFGSYSVANAQGTGNRVLLPVISAGFVLETAAPAGEVPHAEEQALEINAAGRDLGCVNYIFDYYISSSSQAYDWDGKRSVGRGASGPIVEFIQEILVYNFGKDLGNYGVNGVDGHYGNLTKQAVKEIQREARNSGFTACGRSIGVDGVVGPQTWAILFFRQ